MILLKNHMNLSCSGFHSNFDNDWISDDGDVVKKDTTTFA